MYSWNDGVLIELSRIEIKQIFRIISVAKSVLIELSRIEIEQPWKRWIRWRGY